MRIWSIHPKYLDSKGLTGLWREAILGKRVLLGETKGYRNHPQLDRFKDQVTPWITMQTYLYYVFKESLKRGFKFNPDFVGHLYQNKMIEVTDGQLEYETRHLKNKLRERDKESYKKISDIKILEPHPLFTVVEGDVEVWEKV